MSCATMQRREGARPWLSMPLGTFHLNPTRLRKLGRPLRDHERDAARKKELQNRKLMLRLLPNLANPQYRRQQQASSNTRETPSRAHRLTCMLPTTPSFRTSSTCHDTTEPSENIMTSFMRRNFGLPWKTRSCF